ncbi:NlpC/P60 family protein [Capnocytophaga canimorsus]|uniref:C40 family peptidase n=1 Tax=Capnocytophaga canimorsus TaxID=28188 RepID=UPI0037D4E61E
MERKIFITPYGICNQSVVPVRSEPSHTAEMCTQLLFGELLQVIEKQESWSLIRILFDGYEGWVSNKQFLEISDKEYRKALKKRIRYAHNLVTKLPVKQLSGIFLQIPKGADFTHNSLLKVGMRNQKPKNIGIIATAMEYLEVPYLWGGRTPFGIDCSGFVQMVYKLNGIALLRDAWQQASQGELISFIEESVPGDLAFFDNEEGKIIHVGILLGDNRIIHAHGKVRIDRIDHVGIFNTEIRNYSHQLRMMKRIIQTN